MRFFLRFIDIVFVTFGEFLFNTKTVVPFGLKHPSVNEKKIKLTVSFFLSQCPHCGSPTAFQFIANLLTSTQINILVLLLLC